MTPKAALEGALRQERGRLLAALVARTRDFQRAEDALQEAAASALLHWGRAGVPDRPEAWLLRVALRKAIDQYRRSGRDSRNAAALALLARDEAELPDRPDIPDDRLQLIFACCHPALDPKSRVALTLRSVCGLSTAQIAAVYLDAEPTLGQRLSRAKAKIAAAGIPFAVPGPELWPERLNAVLTVVYLVFTAGYAAGPVQGCDLCDEALFLARLLDRLCPGQAEIEGCLALLLLTHARRKARLDPEGPTIALALQDRTRWDRSMIAEGLTVLEQALARRRPGPFQIKAAIAACHATEGTPDWPQIAALYDRLLQIEPGPVVRLNRAVAHMEAGGLALARDEVAALAGPLAQYQPYHAASAEVLARSRLWSESLAAYDRAIELAEASADADFLRNRRKMLLEAWAETGQSGKYEKKGRAEARPKSNREV
jgi:RNA polymerase sigma-70 factor (ECF subfamily)